MSDRPREFTGSLSAYIAEGVRSELCEAYYGGKDAMEALRAKYQTPINPYTFAAAAQVSPRLVFKELMDIDRPGDHPEDWPNPSASAMILEATQKVLDFIATHEPILKLYSVHEHRWPKLENWAWWVSNFEKSEAYKANIHSWITGSKEHGNFIE